MAYDLPSLMNLPFEHFCKNLHVLQVSGRLNNVCSRCSFMNLESAVSSLSWFWLAETTDPPAGHAQVSPWWLCDVRSPKTPPSHCANPTIFFPWRGLQLSCALGIYMKDHYLTFSLFLITFLHGPHASALSHKYLQPLAWGEADLRLGLLCPHLADSWINLFSASNLHVSTLGMLNFGAKFRNKYTWYFKYKNPD